MCSRIDGSFLDNHTMTIVNKKKTVDVTLLAEIVLNTAETLFARITFLKLQVLRRHLIAKPLDACLRK